MSDIKKVRRYFFMQFGYFNTGVIQNDNTIYLIKEFPGLKNNVKVLAK